MTAELFIWPRVTDKDLSPVAMLQAALAKGNLTQVVIIGWDADGDEFFSSSVSDGPETLWLLERVKHKLIKLADQD